MIHHVPKLFPDGFMPLGLLFRIFVIISFIESGGLNGMMLEGFFKV